MQLKDPKKLARLMVIKDVSQRDLAKAAGWGKSHSFVGRLLNGKASTLSVESAARIAHFLECGVDDLFLVKVSSSIEQNGPQKGRTR